MSNHRISDRQVEMLAGLSAGFATTTFTHPLEVIKVRLQLSSGVNTRPFQSLMQVIGKLNSSATASFSNRKTSTLPFKNYKAVHLIQQYYRGIGPNLVGNIAGWGLYFMLYAEFKKIIQTPQATINYFASSTLAGLSTSLLTNPIWVLKTRILGTLRGETNSYRSFADGVKTIYRKEGLSTFWKGSIPSMVLVFQASLQFTLYDHMKNHFLSTRPRFENSTGKNLTTTEFIYASAVSKVFSMTVMYPMQVVKTRLQTYNVDNEKRSITLVCKTVWNNEGRLKGFYKGISVNMVRVVPATCITFVVYETVKQRLSGDGNS